jgi:predicted permease
MLADIARDLRHALRSLSRTRAFAATALLTLALGIGANTAIFTVIRAVLLKPLDYPGPDRVILISSGATTVRFDELRASVHSFPEIGDYPGGTESITLAGLGEPEVLKGSRVSANFLRILGVRPALGRGFRDEEDQPSAARAALISTELWQRRFGADPAVIGRTADLSSTPYTIVGVMPANFQFPSPGVDVWITRPGEFMNSTSPMLSVFGRLKPGVTLAQAAAEVDVINHRYAAAHPGMLDAKPGTTDHPAPLKERLVDNVRSLLWMLFGAVSFVLLIACANVSSLLLARAASRSREFAVRAALGAGRLRLMSQLLSESLLLAAGGGALGLALAQLSLRAITRMTALGLPRLEEIRLDGSVLLFALGVSVLTGLLFGLAPSFGASRPNLADVLRAHGQAASSHRSLLHFSPRRLLVTVQVALSMVLLIGAALLIQSLARTYRVDMGFNSSNLLSMRIALSPTRYDTNQKKSAFYDAVINRVESLPGVRGAGITWTTPLMVFAMMPVQPAAAAPSLLNQRPLAMVQNITPDYFRTMEVPLKRGRDFSPRDIEGAPQVVIINETLAREFWPVYPSGPDPVGQRMLLGARTEPTQIVGIVADMHQAAEVDPRPAVFRPYAQVPQPSNMFVVRTSGDPLRSLRAITAEIQAVDPDQAVSDVQTMEDRAVSVEGQTRVIIALLTAFAGTALLLALVGIYGLIAYSVTQRTQELGIRRALGAQGSDILSLVVGQGFVSVAVGVVLGLAASVGLTRVMESILFHISPTDPATFAGVALLFLAVALMASYIPARRAARIDPASALRI